MTFLYGLERSNHNFSDPASLGKNVFTNAFPIALTQYMSLERNLPVPLITARISDNGEQLETWHEPTPWNEIISTDPKDAQFLFETVYSGFSPFTHGSANKSDIVVADEHGKHLRPFEVKLVVVPTSGTSHLTREQQSCELVVRPPSVEQLAFSLAESFGQGNRMKLLDTINDSVPHILDYRWDLREFMFDHLAEVVTAAKAISKAAIKSQQPMFLTSIWRTEGQTPKLDHHAFDTFCWTNVAFLQIFIKNAEKSIGNKKKEITRPARALTWLVNSLLQYGVQGSLNFAPIHSVQTYGSQTDKAGAFTRDAILPFLQSPEFLMPRITSAECEQIVTPEALPELMPERRLDAALVLQSMLNARGTA